MSEAATIINKLTRESYRARRVRLIHGPARPNTHEGYEAWYSWLVNDWILNQPDRDELMVLFILLGFNATAFTAAVTGQFEKWALANPGEEREP